MDSIEQISGVRVKRQSLVNTAGLLPGIFTIFTLIPNFTYGGEALSVVDDIGRTVRLERPATRIVSLAPHVTENLFAAGIGHRVIGAVNYSDYPVEARRIPSVGGYDNFDIETILTLQPDLVVAWKEGNQFQQVERLMKLGLTVFVNEPNRLEDVASDIIRFGILGGREDEARTAARNISPDSPDCETNTPAWKK